MLNKLSSFYDFIPVTEPVNPALEKTLGNFINSDKLNFSEISDLFETKFSITKRIYRKEKLIFCASGKNGNLAGIPVGFLKNLFARVFQLGAPDIETADTLSPHEEIFAKITIESFISSLGEFWQENIVNWEYGMKFPLVITEFSSEKLNFPVFFSPSPFVFPQINTPEAAISPLYSMILSCGFLSSEILASIEVGSLIYTGFSASYNFFLGDGMYWLPVKLEERDLISSGEPFMKPSISANLSMDITIEIGRIRLSGSDFDSLFQGARLSTGIKPGGQVALTHDNHVIAHGELQVADNELVIQVTDVFQNQSLK
ncbi:MAG: FliM/FliN family flagellar motor switch protein [Deltaproteobacteria bacterium]|nr:FliM/FliN family flagellar motor switch protein [Deltaproteobacteria bacterium]